MLALEIRLLDLLKLLRQRHLACCRRDDLFELFEISKCLAFGRKKFEALCGVVDVP